MEAYLMYDEIRELEKQFGEVRLANTDSITYYEMKGTHIFSDDIIESDMPITSIMYTFTFVQICTTIYDNVEVAQKDLINQIKEFCKGKTGKHATLCWRVFPTIDRHFGQETGRNLYAGYARLQVIGKPDRKILMFNHSKENNYESSLRG